MKLQRYGQPTWFALHDLVVEKGYPHEIIGNTYYREIVLDQQMTFNNYTFYITDVRFKAFVLEEIRIFGLASDLLDGSLQMVQFSKIFIDQPLIHFTPRAKYVLPIPILFYENMDVRLTWKTPITTGLDLLGKPRDVRKIQILLSGVSARPIQ